MPNPTVKRTAKVCANPACGCTFRPTANYSRQRYCCHPCSVQARPRLSLVLAGRKGAEAKRQRRSERLPYLKAMAYRRGFADGYEQALRDLDQAYAAMVGA